MTAKQYKNQAKKYLELAFGKVGEAVFPPLQEREEQLSNFFNHQRDDTFCMIFDLREKRIRRVSVHLSKVLGYHFMTYDEWISIIHPDFLPLYVEFGFAAYKIGQRLKGQLSDKKASYSMNVPVKRMVNGQPEYWLVKQSAYPFEFDQDWNMVSHINLYTLLGRYDSYFPMKPIVTFNYASQADLEREILAHTREIILGSFFAELSKKPQEVLLTYWVLFSAFQTGELKTPPTAGEVAKRQGVKTITISGYNKEIKRVVNEIFPISSFPDILSIVSFFYRLFGPITAPQ